jgi:acyl carrier protein
MRTLEQTVDEVLDLAAAEFKVPRARLSPNDDFFEKLGIDSLRMLDLLMRLEKHFKLQLTNHELQDVSDFQTLAQRIHCRF